MPTKMSKMREYLAIIAVMLTVIPIVADAAIIPISNNLYSMFPDNTGAVNFIVSGPQLLLAIASLIAVPVMTIVSKKTILVISGVFCAVSLCLGVAIHNVWYILICRSIAGVGAGFIHVVGVAMITEIFTNDERRSNMMGIYNAVMSAAGTFISYCSGRLAVFGWTNAYQVFYICIPMVISFILFLPKDQSKKETVKCDFEQFETSSCFDTQFWLTMLSLFLFFVTNMGIAYFVSVYVAENALGDEAFAGIVASLTTVGSFIFCLGFGSIYNKLQGKLAPLLYILFALCIALLIFVPSKTVLLIATLLSGGTYGCIYSYAYAHVPNFVSSSQKDTVISIITFVSSFGFFLATYLVTFLMDLNGGSFTASLPCMLGLALLAVILEFLVILSNKKKLTT